MAKYLLYAHLQSISTATGRELNGSQPIGIIGSTGSGAIGTHLHFAVEEKSSDPDISFFYKWGSATRNPNDIIKQYGKVTPNDVTLQYKATTSPYSTYNPHEGIDFSGVIDKPYESAIAHSPENGKVKVIKTGYDNSYGNYVICKLIGGKTVKAKPTNVIHDVTSTDNGGTIFWFKGTFKLNNGSRVKPWVDLYHMGTGKKYTGHMGTENIEGKYNTYKNDYNNSTTEMYWKIDLKNLPKGTYKIKIGGTDVMDNGERISVSQDLQTHIFNNHNWSSAQDEAQNLILEIRNKTDIYVTKK